MSIGRTGISETARERNRTVFKDRLIYRDITKTRSHVVDQNRGVILTESTILIDD